MNTLISDFKIRLSACNSNAVAIFSKKGIDSWERSYLTESLVSDIWQGWCFFTKELIGKSCLGTTTTNSVTLSSIAVSFFGVTSVDWRHIGFAASKIAQSRPYSPVGGVINSIRQEPTWGDIDKLINIVSGLPIANKNTILPFLSQPEASRVRHVQKIRNAFAHRSAENDSELLRVVSPDYQAASFINPEEYVWSKHSSTNNMAVFTWINDMDYLATEMTR